MLKWCVTLSPKTKERPKMTKTDFCNYKNRKKKWESFWTNKWKKNKNPNWKNKKSTKCKPISGKKTDKTILNTKNKNQTISEWSTKNTKKFSESRCLNRLPKKKEERWLSKNFFKTKQDLRILLTKTLKLLKN